MAKASHGINPITLRGIDNRTGKATALTMMRMHVGIGDKVNKLFTVVMYDESEGIEPRDAAHAEARMQGFVVLDEDHVLSGLYHLFPTGEMDHGDTSPAAVNAELIDALTAAVKELGRLEAPAEAIAPLQALLTRVQPG